MTIVDLYKSLFGRKGIEDGDVISMSEHGRVGGISTGQPFKFTRDIDETVALDVVDSNTTYVGVAKIGSSQSGALWQIFKVLKSGTITTVTYADGNDNFDNVWDDRVSLSYS